MFQYVIFCKKMCSLHCQWLNPAAVHSYSTVQYVPGASVSGCLKDTWFPTLPMRQEAGDTVPTREVPYLLFHTCAWLFNCHRVQSPDNTSAFCSEHKYRLEGVQDQMFLTKQISDILWTQNLCNNKVVRDTAQESVMNASGIFLFHGMVNQPKK